MFKRRSNESSTTTKDSYSSYESFKVPFIADFVESNSRVPNVAETLDAYAKSRGWRSPPTEGSASYLSFGGLLEKSIMGGTHFDQLVAHLRQVCHSSGESDNKNERWKRDAIDDFEATVQQLIYFTTTDIEHSDQAREPESSTGKLTNGSISSRGSALAPGYIAISNRLGFETTGLPSPGAFPFEKEAMTVQSGTNLSSWGSRPRWTTGGGPGTIIPHHWVILINVNLLLMDSHAKRAFQRNTWNMNNPKALSFREFLAETAADIVTRVERRSRLASASPESLQPLTLNADGYFISQEKSGTQVSKTAYTSDLVESGDCYPPSSTAKASPTSPIKTQKLSPTSPIETQLAEIEELLAKGLINQAEHDALRRRILGI